MGNAFALILKYGQYLKFLPLLVGIVRFVRDAERKFREAGSGADKARWVQSQLFAILDLAESVGLIGADFARSVREGSAHLIKMFVEGIKDVQGAVPPLEGDAPSSTPAVSAFPYEKIVEADPDRSLLKSRDKIYQFGDESRWIVRQGGVGIGALPEGWKLIETVK
jgi:hypothetical protein